MNKGNQTTNNSKKSKASQKKLDSKSVFGNENINNSLPDLTVPKLKKSVSNNKLAEKIDNLSQAAASKDDLTNLANKTDLKKLQDVSSKKNNELQKTITQKMQDQNSKLYKATIDMRDVAYSKGVLDDNANTRQRVDALQKRVDNSKQNLSDIARQNDAMNADFKQIGKTLAESTKAINTNNQNLVWLYQNGIKIHTDDITKSVIEEFERITGQSYESLISNTILQKLKGYFEETKQASATSRLMAQTTVNATNANYEAISQLKKDMNQYLVEFAGILLLTTATPGLWKLLTVTATTAVSIIFNSYTQRKDETNDN